MNEEPSLPYVRWFTSKKKYTVLELVSTFAPTIEIEEIIYKALRQEVEDSMKEQGFKEVYAVRRTWEDLDPLIVSFTVDVLGVKELE
jgi:hypothetical protein